MWTHICQSRLLEDDGKVAHLVTTLHFRYLGRLLPHTKKHNIRVNSHQNEQNIHVHMRTDALRSLVKWWEAMTRNDVVWPIYVVSTYERGHFHRDRVDETMSHYKGLRHPQ